MVNLVFRAVSGADRPGMVGQCLQSAAPRAGCSLTEFGCPQLSWELAAADDEWPRLEVVAHAIILRFEHEKAYWQALVERHGVVSMPSTPPTTAVDRRITRLFITCFIRGRRARKSFV